MASLVPELCTTVPLWPPSGDMVQWRVPNNRAGGWRGSSGCPHPWVPPIQPGMSVDARRGISSRKLDAHNRLRLSGTARLSLSRFP